MHEYIIILYPGTGKKEIYDDYFFSYDEAKETADTLSLPYEIYVSCSDTKNLPM